MRGRCCRSKSAPHAQRPLCISGVTAPSARQAGRFAYMPPLLSYFREPLLFLACAAVHTQSGREVAACGACCAYGLILQASAVLQTKGPDPAYSDCPTPDCTTDNRVCAVRSSRASLQCHSSAQDCRGRRSLPFNGLFGSARAAQWAWGRAEHPHTCRLRRPARQEQWRAINATSLPLMLEFPRSTSSCGAWGAARRPRAAAANRTRAGMPPASPHAPRACLIGRTAC
jgi:hypothetical protein